MKIAAALLATALLLTACGGSDEPAPAPTSATSGADEDQRDLTDEQAEHAEKEGQELADDVAEAAAGTVVDIELLSGRESTPQGARVEVEVGEKVTLRVTSAIDEELHVHSDPDHTFQVAAGDEGKEFSFTVETPGQVAVEGHHSGLTIVQLVVRP